MLSAQENLQNLLKIGKLKAEPQNSRELDGLLSSAGRKLPDAENLSLSPDSRFSLAYDAAHTFALAALRWHGYRSENRYIVFQVLGHTLNFPTAKWRFLDSCHQKRNAALYEGDYTDDEQLIKELVAAAKDLKAAVESLGPVRT